jgi:hypothetical protein
MHKLTRVCAAAAALLVGGAANADVVIDLFDVLQDPLVVTAGTDEGPKWSQVGNVGETSIFGGFRDLGIGFVPGNSTSTPGNASVGVVAGLGAGLGHSFLSIANDPGVSSTAIVRWDGAQAGAGSITDAFGAPDGGTATNSVDHNGIGLPMGNPLTDFFEVLVISSDLGFTFTIELYTSDTQWSSITFTANAYAESFPGEATYIPLAGFLDCDNLVPGPITTCGADGAVDFSNVGAMQLIVDPLGSQADIDLRLNQVTTVQVPEPGTMALVGLGLLGAAGFSARRRKVS